MKSTLGSLGIGVSPKASNGSVPDTSSEVATSVNLYMAVGIGVGTSAGIAGLIVVVILVLVVWRKRRHKFQGVYYTTETGRPNRGGTLLTLSVKTITTYYHYMM